MEYETVYMSETETEALELEGSQLARYVLSRLRASSL